MTLAQHFLLSAKARTISLKAVFGMGEDKAYETFCAIRWADTDGTPVCPRCGCVESYSISTRRRFKCVGCHHQYSVTSGTIFASRKLSFTDLLAAIVIFVNGAKGVSALQVSRDLDVQYKTAFVLSHKLREAMAVEAPAMVSGVVEVDGAYFGGYVKPANYKVHRRDRRLVANRSGKREAVVVMRERRGRSLTYVAKTEGSAVPAINAMVATGSTLHLDEAGDWDVLHGRYDAIGSITHSAIRTALPARIWLKVSSAAYAARRSARTTASLGRTSPPTRARWRGARTTAAFPTAGSSRWWWRALWRPVCRASGRAIGSGPLR